eukprot:4130872-Ditylum_brightwellii.AAC.3
MERGITTELTSLTSLNIMDLVSRRGCLRSYRAIPGRRKSSLASRRRNQASATNRTRVKTKAAGQEFESRDQETHCNGYKYPKGGRECR